jgi:hypothetical protein
MRVRECFGDREKELVSAKYYIFGPLNLYLYGIRKKREKNFLEPLGDSNMASMVL